MRIISQWLTQYLVAIGTRIQHSRCFLMWSIKVLKSKTCHCYQFRITQLHPYNAEHKKWKVSNKCTIKAVHCVVYGKSGVYVHLHSIVNVYVRYVTI